MTVKILKTSDLVAADLPNLEAPYAAAQWARSLILADHSGRFNLERLLTPLPTHGVRARDRSRLVEDVLRKIRSGQLWLVYGVGDGRPFDPVIRWNEPALGQGRGHWVLNGHDAPWALRHGLNSLNDRGVTPQQLARHEAGGIGTLPANNLAQELRLKSKEDAVQQQPAANSQTPFPARPVAPLPSPLPSPATAPEQSAAEPSPEIHLEVGLFTDGTLNNADNSQALEAQVKATCTDPLERGEISEAECQYRLGLLLGDSYANAPSNVAKLADLYIESSEIQGDRIMHRFVVYAPGVGTKTGDGDSVIGMATGMGETGILSQVNGAFGQIAQRIFRLALRGPITTLQVDLVGFSRGAASARHAAHEISLGPEGALGRALSEAGVDWPEQVTIRFAGLFDTVAAIINPANGDLSPSNGRNLPVQLYLDPSKVTSAVHLIASDEHREKFALNSLRNADGSLPENFREISLPGVHSDIGGGYHDDQREDVLISPLHRVSNDRISWPEQSVQWDLLQTLKREKAAEGWIGDFSLPVRSSIRTSPSPSKLGPEGEASLEIYKEVSEHPVPYGRTELALRMVRQVRGEYSRVTLRVMHLLAREAGVPLKEIPKRADLDLPEELKPLSISLRDQVAGCDVASPSLSTRQLNLLRQRYIHYSAHYNALKFMKLGAPITFRLFRNFNPNAPTHSGERIVHPNR